MSNLKDEILKQVSYKKKPTKGVTFNKLSKKWVAYMSVEGKHFHLGTYDTEDEALKVRAEADTVRAFLKQREVK